MNTRRIKWLTITIGILGVLAVIVLGSWIVTETALEHTSDEDFCTLCHTMRPFAATHARDVHGGQNPYGIAATCTDCHLPHDDPATYLVGKARTGVADVWAQLGSIFVTPDWSGNLERRSEFTYDSGCLGCHSHLEQATDISAAEKFGHSLYFKDPQKMSCVSCHAHVGHKDLASVLAPTGEAATATPAATTSGTDSGNAGH